MSFFVELTALALVAMLADAAIGGVFLLGRFPGPDRFFHYIAQSLTFKLDQPRRSERTLAMRGGLLLLASLIILLPIGIWLGQFFISGTVGYTIGIIFLIMVMGQRAALDTAIELITILSDIDSRQDRARFDAARWGIERLVLRLCDGMIVNAVILFITGLGGLLFYRFLTMLLSLGAPDGILKPAGAFYKIPLIVYEVMTAIPAAIATMLFLLASLFIPEAKFHLLSIIEEEVEGSIFGRKLPLLTMAYALNFSFRQDPNISRKKTVWVGPQDGRRKLESEDLRNALYLIIATWVMALIMISLMAFPMIYKI